MSSSIQNSADKATQGMGSEYLNWALNHKTILLGGSALAASAILMLNGHSAEINIHQIEKAAPWVVGGMAVAEAAWIGGAVVCAGQVGSQLPRISLNPLKIKNTISEIGRIKTDLPSIMTKACDTKTFKAGFWVNTTAAVAEFVIPASVVTTHLPVESWGILGFSLIDLGATIATRKAIIDAQHTKH